MTFPNENFKIPENVSGPGTFNVKSFGAKGDGVADDTAAIQKAINSLSTGQILFFPSGTYKVTSTLKLTKDGIKLVGNGVYGTHISLTGTGSVIESSIKTTAERKYCEISDLRFVTNNNTLNVPALDLTYCRETVIRRIFITGGGDQARGILFQGLLGTADATYNYVYDSYIGAVKDGVVLTNVANSCRVQNTRIQAIGGNSIILSSVNNADIVGCSFEYPGKVTNGVNIAGNCDGVTVIGCRFESMNLGIVVSAGALNVLVLGNYYSSNTTNVSNAAGDGVTVLDGAGVLKMGDFSMGHDPTGGFFVNENIILPAVDKANVPIGKDRLFFDTVSSKLYFRSYRSNSGVVFQQWTAGAWDTFFEVTQEGMVTLRNAGTLPTLVPAMRGRLIRIDGMTAVAEVASLQITAATTATGNVTVTLDGVATNVAVALSDTAIQAAGKIRAATFTGWTTGGTAGTDTVTFTAATTGAKVDSSYSAGTTGATGIMTTTTQGVTSTADAVYVCKKLANDTYDWVQIG